MKSRLIRNEFSVLELLSQILNWSPAISGSLGTREKVLIVKMILIYLGDYKFDDKNIIHSWRELVIL